jgi:NhaP-type Na+/H+ or K+/H+ antiporter
LMALVLAPTDSTLCQAFMKSDKIPENIRQSLSVENGLNDGLALPLILICLPILGAQTDGYVGYGEGIIIKRVMLGPLVGFAVGWMGGKLIQVMSDRGWMEEKFQRLSALPLAILAFSLSESVGGNGFAAAFAAGFGLTLGAASAIARHRVREFGETEGTQLILVVFLIFGFVMVPVAVRYWGWTELIYALLSLTVIRMLPVAISLAGTRLGWKAVMLVGWFGPRGIACVLYVLMAVGALGLGGYEQVFSTIVLTILISVYAHGISSVPLGSLSGKSTVIK